MPVPVVQLIAMAYYEFLMQWRRKSWWVVMVSLVSLNLAFLLLNREAVHAMTTEWASAGGVQSAEIQAQLTLTLLPRLGATLFLMLVLMFPIAATDAIPVDRQFKMEELLFTLPLRASTYLTGKLLGTEASMLGGLAVVMVVTGVAMWLLAGPYQVGAYLALWVGLGGVLLLNPGMAMLLAAGNSTRRGAALTGVGFAILCLFGLYRFVSPLHEPLSRAWNLLNPARPLVFQHFVLGRLGFGATGGTLPDVWWTLAVSGAELALVWLLVWGWRRWQSSR